MSVTVFSVQIDGWKGEETDGYEDKLYECLDGRIDDENDGMQGRGNRNVEDGKGEREYWEGKREREEEL